MVVMAGLWPSFADDILISVLHPHPEVLTISDVSQSQCRCLLCKSHHFPDLLELGIHQILGLVELFAWYFFRQVQPWSCRWCHSSKEVILEGQVNSLSGFPWQHMAASWQAATKITW